MSEKLTVGQEVRVRTPRGTVSGTVTYVGRKLASIRYNGRLGDFDMDVSVDVAGLSPVTQDSQRAQWMQLLALLSTPSILMLLGSSDLLLKKVISLYGIRQQSEVAEIQKSVQALSTVLGQQAGQQGAGQPGAGQPGVTAMPGAGGAPGGAGAPMQPFQTGGIDPAKMLASLGPKGPQ